MDAKKIGQVVLFHRKTAGLSREACAELAGVGKTVVYDLEQGKPTIQLDTLQKILAVLNIKIVLESPMMQKFEQEISKKMEDEKG